MNPNPTSPVTVGTLRAIALLAASGAILATITAVSDLRGGQIATIAPFIVAALRIVESFVDKARGQAPQNGLGGSRPA